MDDGNQANVGKAELWPSENEPALSNWRRAGNAVRDLWLTVRRGRPEQKYAERTLRRLARGQLRDTLGLEVRDESATRLKSEQWLARMVELGLKPHHTCVEYGCGSLWCAEPVVKHLQPGRFIGLDVTDGFYELGRQRLAALLSEKQVRLAVISPRALAEAAAAKPDFVYSHRVLHHVPHRGLSRYMRNICSLLSENTILVIEHMPRPNRDRSSKAPRYNLADIRPYLPRNWICRQFPFGFVAVHRDSAGSIPGLARAD